MRLTPDPKATFFDIFPDVLIGPLFCTFLVPRGLKKRLEEGSWHDPYLAAGWKDFRRFKWHMPLFVTEEEFVTELRKLGKLKVFATPYGMSWARLSHQNRIASQAFIRRCR